MRKQCNSCCRNRSVKFFNRDSSRNDGLDSKCRDCRRQCNRHYRSTTQTVESKKRFHARNPGSNSAYVRKHYRANRQRVLQRTRQWQADNPNWIVRQRIQNGICRAFAGVKKPPGCFRYLPYTVAELRRHIESRFKPGMTWENHGLWEIDHIIPHSRFSYRSQTDPEFAECWALSNLQPLWKEENRRKGAKLGFLEPMKRS